MKGKEREREERGRENDCSNGDERRRRGMSYILFDFLSFPSPFIPGLMRPELLCDTLLLQYLSKGSNMSKHNVVVINCFSHVRFTTVNAQHT